MNIEENSRYLIRNNLSQTVMQYEFIKTKEIYGIDTYEFHGHISDMPKKNYPFTPPSALVKTLWPTMKDYRSQPNAVLDYSVEIYVEPKSGIVVDRTDIATLTSVAEGPKSKTPIFISEIKFTEQTTLDNINRRRKENFN